MGRWMRSLVLVTSLMGLLGATSQPEQQELSSGEAAPAKTASGSMSTSTSPGGESDAGPPMRISMEFENARLEDVLKAFSQQTGINLVAIKGAGVRTVTLYLEDVAVMDALDQILEAANLTYERAPGSQIYLVKPARATMSDEITRVYRLRFARVSGARLGRAAEALAKYVPQGIEARMGGSSGGSSGSSGGGGGGTGTGSVGVEDRDLGIDQIIAQLLTPVGSVQVDIRTNSLIVTDVPDNFARIESVLNTLDVRTAQILIEAELLETTVGKLKDLGLEWGTGSEADMGSLTPGSRSTKFPFTPIFGHMGATGDTRFTASTLDFSSAKGVLQALERDSQTKILAQPKILTLDNERAIIQLTTDQAVGFKSTTTSTAGTTSVQPERTTTGIILVVTPQVNEDRYVTMLVEPSVTKTVTASVSPPATLGTVVDPKSRSARALVRVRDGETLVLGGLIDRSDQQIVRRVPILGRIPVLGELFTNTELDNSATELVVFVTPRITAEMQETASNPVHDGRTLAPRVQEGSEGRKDSIDQALQRLERSPL